MAYFRSFNVFDIAALIFIVVSTLHGCFRGLSGELAHLVSVVVAFIFGLYFYQPFGSWLLENTRLTDQPARALAFLTTILVALVAMILLRFVLRRIMRIVFEEKIDKVAGCFAGFIRSSVIVIIIFLVMNLWPNEYLNRRCGEESVIGGLLLKYVPSLREEAASPPVSGY